MGGDRTAAFRERAWLRAPCPPKPWRRSMARSTRPRLFAGARPFRRKAIVAGSTLRHLKFPTFPHLLPGIALERGSEFRYTARAGVNLLARNQRPNLSKAPQDRSRPNWRAVASHPISAWWSPSNRTTGFPKHAAPRVRRWWRPVSRTMTLIGSSSRLRRKSSPVFDEARCRYQHLRQRRA